LKLEEETLISPFAHFLSYLPGRFDVFDPRHAIGKLFRSQLILPLIFSSVHYGEAKLGEK